MWPSIDNLKATSPSPETLMFLCPLYTMFSGSLRPVALQPTSLDVATRENLIEDCSEGLFDWWRKHLDQMPQIQADLQTQGKTVSICTIRHQFNERGFYGRRPRKTPLLKERQKKAHLEFSKTHLTKNPSGGMSCGQMRPN